MTVRDVIENLSGEFKVCDDHTGRSLAQLNTIRAEDWNRYSWIDSEVLYLSPCLSYFSNSKKAEYSAKLNIYI